ncbi:hydroxyacid dehydrogenase [Enterococcus villorum]|uniref:Hydroxyacid dehydrogenase n=1 Tax=Enterococcus villorum TaxID=112904 RepID=A0A1V8YE93_9ENTE|nr:phosphoglycerate dehydrogenase [Enterococcus villorum]OQO70912.1 hydroxyacid dehydrogenase [Enterococcus villorum]OQO74901.1 hydroxyacid dehydrogenase [Enterococcus villorum]
MAEKIIYLDREFRPEFIDEMNQLAPDYTVKTELESADIPHVEISLGWNRKYEKDLLASDHLKWVHSISAGVDALPLTTFSEKGILLSNGSGIHSQSIAEHIIGVILGYSRGLFQSQKAQLNKKWLGTAVHYQALEKQKLLIVGTGKIGKLVAQKADNFGISCYGINTTGHPVDGFIQTYPLKELKQIISQMDIVVNILPLTEQTKGLYNERLFEHFATHTLFINVGRGDSVKTIDLIQALDEGKLAFAALDVFEEEPLPKESPLWEMDNVLLTSHIAGLTPDFQNKLMAIFLKNLKSYIENQEITINKVGLKKGY